MQVEGGGCGGGWGKEREHTCGGIKSNFVFTTNASLLGKPSPILNLQRLPTA